MTQRLVDGALAALREAGASPRQIRTVWVPGAFELPAAAAHFASQRARPHAIIAVGAIIKGETMQYQALAAAVTQGLSQAAVTTGVPVTCGVVIAETAEQASARAGGSVGNRGTEAAEAAIELLAVFSDRRTR